MPCHHTLEGYLTEYIEHARLGEAARIPLFQAIKVRPYGRGEAELNGVRLNRINAWQMVRRRAKAAGITTEVCNHTFRGTGITAYLENGGTLEKARQMAAHASTRTTQLYDRRTVGTISGSSPHLGARAEAQLCAAVIGARIYRSEWCCQWHRPSICHEEVIMNSPVSFDATTASRRHAPSAKARLLAALLGWAWSSTPFSRR